MMHYTTILIIIKLQLLLILFADTSLAAALFLVASFPYIIFDLISVT